MSRTLIKITMCSLLASFPFVGINAHASGFDRGVGGSSSALSQFNKISGGNISRPALMKNHVPSPALPDASAIDALATGMMLFQMINAMSNGQQQQADLARAQAEAERQRQLEEKRLRVQRALLANKLRGSWDKDEKAMADSLDGSFDLPGDNQAQTDFFGTRITTPSEFNAIERSDLNVTEPIELDLAAPFGSGAKVPLLTTKESIARRDRWYAKRTQWYTPDVQKAILQDGSGAVHDVIIDIVKEYFVPNKYRNAENAIEHGSNVVKFMVNQFKVLDPERLANVAVYGNPAACQKLIGDLNKVSNELNADTKKTAGITSGRLSLLQELSVMLKSYGGETRHNNMCVGGYYP